MKLFHTKGACSLAVRILINELDIDADYESVDLQKKITENGKDYLKINPKGSVPAIELTDGTILTENAVIHQYLADQYGAKNLLPSVGHIERYHILEWVNYVTTEIHKGLSPMFNPQLPQDVKDNFILPMTLKKIEYVDKHLEKNKYLNGETYTLPDGYLFVMITWLIKFKVDISAMKNLSRYFNELKKRKSIQKSLDQEGLNF